MSRRKRARPDAATPAQGAAPASAGPPPAPTTAIGWAIRAGSLLSAAILVFVLVRALPEAVDKQRAGRLARIRAACQDVLRPDPVNAALGTLPAAAPEFALPDWAGRTVSLSSLRGRVVLVNLWATWCPTCVVEMPSLERLAAAEKGRPFSLVAVSVDEDWPTVRRFFAHGSQLTVLLDPGKTVPRAYGTEKFPESFLVDRDGTILFYVVSERDWGSARMRACIEAALE